MTAEQIQTLIDGWVESELEAFEDALANSLAPDDEERDGQTSILGDRLEGAWSDLVSNRFSAVETIADGLLVAQGVTGVAKDSTAYKRLFQGLLVARMDVLKQERQRVDGEYTPSAPGRHNGAVPSPAPAPIFTTLFSAVSEAYLKEHSHRQPRTQYMIRSSLAEFLEVTGGDRPAGHITKDECRAYKEHMVAAGLVAASVNKHLGNLNHMLTWAAKHGYAPNDWKNDSPAYDLKFSKRIVRAQSTDIVPFEDAELVTIFSSKEFLRWKDQFPERYYGLLALLLSAARREEVYQLDMADVVQDPASNVWYLNFIDSDDKALKNAHSRRRCPVSNFLVDVGFLTYAEKIRAQGHKRLFPQLEHGINGYGDEPGKAWARLIKKLGIGGEGKVLHSLPHGGCTKMAE